MKASSLRAFSELSAAAGSSLWGTTVTIGGSGIAATLIPPDESATLSDYAEEPGFIPLIVRIRKADLATAPARDTYLTWNSRRWKVRSVQPDRPTEAEHVLTCEPAS